MAVIQNKKYSALKATAKDLFWKYGFRRVSIDEICQKAGVSKMTFYKFFPNKRELAKTIFNDVVDACIKSFRKILKSDKSPADKIKEILLMKLKSTNDISSEFMQDFYIGGDTELTSYVENKTKQVWENIRNDYKEAQEAGLFRKDFNTELLIKMQFKLAEVLEDESIMKMYDSPQDLIMEFANLIVYGIIPHNKR